MNEALFLRLANSSSWAKSVLQPFFVNNVLLRHNHTHLLYTVL